MKLLPRQRPLIVLGIAESVSGIGSWITAMAVFALIVFRGNGSVAQSGGIFLAGLLPMLLFSPLAGWLCDHFDRKKLMIASELLSGAAIAGLIFADQLALIYALLAIQSAFGSLMTPARQSAIPDLVPSDEITRANAFLQQLASMVKIGAPMLAGLVLSLIDPHAAMTLDVVSFALSAAILLLLPALPRHANTRAATKQPASTSGAAGVRSALRAAPLLRLLFVLAFLTVVVIMGFDVLSSVFVRDVLRGDEQFFGLLIGLIGMGSVGGTLWLMLQKRASDPWRDVVAGLLLLGVIPASLALAIWLHTPALGRLVVALGCLVGGIGNGLLVVQASTLLQTLAPPALRGRISGMFQSTTVAGQLLTLVAVPVLVPALVPLGAYFAGATIAIVLVAAFVVASLRAQPTMPAAEGPGSSLPGIAVDR